MRYMTIEMDNNGNEFETEHMSPQGAIIDAMDKWMCLSDAQRRTDRIMAVTVRDNYGEDNNGCVESDFVEGLWDSNDGEVWATRVRETGEVIDLFPSREEAEAELEEYEDEDMRASYEVARVDE